jgi:hypothetical protein
MKASSWLTGVVGYPVFDYSIECQLPISRITGNLKIHRYRVYRGVEVLRKVGLFVGQRNGHNHRGVHWISVLNIERGDHQQHFGQVPWALNLGPEKTSFGWETHY